MRALPYLLLLVMVACTNATPSLTPEPVELRPYLTATAAPTNAAQGGLIVTPPAVPATATPFLYTIKPGDTLGQIAEAFHLSLDALVSDNPEVDPSALSVGQQIQIPGGAMDVPGNASPTPAPLAVDQVACHRIANGGLWCFVLVRNDTSEIIEDISASVQLVTPDGGRASSQTALLPLDILPPKQALPLAAYFPPGTPEGATPRIQILSAIRLPPDQSRYLPAHVTDTLAQVAWSGLSAQLSGRVLLPTSGPAASSIWVAAAAYDETGSVVGVRKWESNSSLQPGGSMDFSFTISAVAGRIDRVDYAVEATP